MLSRCFVGAALIRRKADEPPGLRSKQSPGGRSSPLSCLGTLRIFRTALISEACWICLRQIAFVPNAALVDQIANLEFTAVSNTYNARDWTAVFAISGPTVSGEYDICRDGSVYRNGRAVSVTPLSEEATDYFFAVANAWVMCSTETYPVFSGAVYEDSKCIRASSEGKEIFLIGKDAESLAELLTDEENFSFACEPRFNCAPEDHGQALCEFASGSYDSENGFTQSESMYVFTLWSDGHVTALMPPALTCGTLDHDQVCDQLSVSCLYVSETAFDIETVEAFLAEHGG